MSALVEDNGCGAFRSSIPSITVGVPQEVGGRIDKGSMRRLLLVLAACSLFASAQRVRAVPDDSHTMTLTGNRHPLARAAYDLGPAAPGYRMEKMILVLDSSVLS